MGQYYLVCNLTKEQFIHPHKFGDGMKLMEFVMSARGVMTALGILLASGNGRGGGDIAEPKEKGIVGSWAGDRIVIAGDYGDPGKFVTKELSVCARKTFVLKNGTKMEELPNLYEVAHLVFTDVSERVMEALLRDGYFEDTVVAELEEFVRNHGLGDSAQNTYKSPLVQTVEAVRPDLILKAIERAKGPKENSGIDG